MAVVPPTITSSQLPRGCTASAGFLGWLERFGSTLLLASRRADRLLLLRAGGLDAEPQEVPAPGPTAVAAEGDELWLGTGHQVWRFSAVTAPPASPAGSGAPTWVARAGLTVGAIGIRDLQATPQGPLFIS